MCLEKLSPREAVIALLNGETLVNIHNKEIVWSDEKGMARFVTVDCNLSDFKDIYRIKKPETRSMCTFECLAWVNSPESLGWMVSIKYCGNGGVWSDWDIPQRFKYDGQEEYGDPGAVSYRRAKLLPDNSDIDDATIQGFLKEVN